MDKLQIFQNQAAWVITHQGKSDHITDTWMTLHWIPVKYYMEYKMLLFAYSMILPQLTSLICCSLMCVSEPDVTAAMQATESETQEQNVFKMYILCVSTDVVELFPLEVKQTDSLDSFKSGVKSHHAIYKSCYVII